MIKEVLFGTAFACLSVSMAQGQIIFQEDFDGLGGPTAGGPGTYSFPTGWTLINADNLIPDVAVTYVNAAWERREDFANNVLDSAAFSTSWYTPATGPANDWMWTPAINLTNGCVLSWNGLAYDPAFPDGYEVRIWTAGGIPTSVLGSSTVIFSTGAEASSWTNHQVNLAGLGYSNQTVRIGFRNNSNDQFLLLIDDVTVASGLVNDECAGAIDVNVGAVCTPITFDVTGATQSQVGCAGNANDDVWVSFVVPANGEANIEVLGSASFDAVVEAFVGTCGALTSIGCIDGTLAGEVEGVAFTGGNPGETIYMRIYDYFTGVPATTDFVMCIYETTSDNDECAGATPLTVNGSCITTAASNLDASDSGITGCTGTADDDVWFSFVAPAGGAVTIDVTGSLSFDAVVEVFSGACGAPVSMSCTDLTLEGELESTLVSALTPGQTYLVRVYDYFIGAPLTNDFTICVYTATPCVLGAPVGIAETETCGTDTDGGCNMVGTPAYQNITCGQTILGTAWADAGTRDTDWYRFTLGSASTVTLSGAAQFPFQILLLDITAGCPGTIVTNTNGSNCTVATLTQALAAGTYVAYMSPTSYGGAPCGSGFNNYYLTYSGTAPTTPTITPVGPTTVCQGGTVTLNSSAATTYLWSPGGAITPGITATATGSYTVTVTNGNGCSATSAPTSVTVNTMPTATVSGGGVSCNGVAVTVSVALTGAGPWNLMVTNGVNTIPVLAAQSPFNYPVSIAGTYSVVSVTDANSCAGTTSGSATVTTGTSPVAAFTSVTNANTASFTDQSTGANSYAWTFGDGGTDNVANPSHTYTAQGTFDVCQTVTNACGSNQICHQVTILTIGLSDVEQVSCVAYPNPTNGAFNIKVSSALSSYTASVTDLSGRVLMSKFVEHPAMDEALTIDVATGTYLLNIRFDNQLIHTQRLIVNK